MCALIGRLLHFHAFFLRIVLSVFVGSIYPLLPGWANASERERPGPRPSRAAPRAAPLEMPNHTTANNAEVVRSEVEQAATSASPCASEQQLSPSAKLPEDEVAVGSDGDDDEDELIILPKDKSSKVSALGLERPGDG